MERKKLVRKAEPPSKRRIRWPRWTGFRGMTLRSWLELLVVPLALVVIGLVFTMMQDTRQQALENRRADAERELAEQRAQDETLQAYLNQMSQLILDRKLLEAEQGTPLYTLAQARTSTAILRLDVEHNESVTRFLSNSGLAVSGEASAPLLRKITLSHATLSGAHLPNADLSVADLSGADLSKASLDNAIVSRADLSDADLSYAILWDADLRDARLWDGDLRHTRLDFANLSHADLSGADLRDTVAQGDLRYADLSGTNLRGAYLAGGYLYNANLIKADLIEADLTSAYLTDADLTDATDVTNEELEQQVSTLEGATMPNGQKYEDWLKDKDRAEDD